MARIPTFCPACGRRVVRERTPSPDSPAVHRWRHVAEQLGPEEPPAGP